MDDPKAIAPETIDRVARALYATSCMLDPIEEQEPNWGRGGYKTQVLYWEGLARAAVRAALQEMNDGR